MMGDMFLLVFLMLCVGAAAWLLFIWAVRSGQYEDIEGPKYRMLDEDTKPSAVERHLPTSAEHGTGEDSNIASRTKYFDANGGDPK